MFLSIYLSHYQRNSPQYLRSVCIEFPYMVCMQVTLPIPIGHIGPPLFGELVEAAFYYSDRAEEDDSLPKPTPRFAPGANGARMARAPTGLELKEVMRQHGTHAGGQSLRSRPSRRLSFAGVNAPGDGHDDGRTLLETRTQKHRRANLPRRTSAFSSRHDDNV